MKIPLTWRQEKSLTFCIAISCNTSPLCKTNMLCYQPYQTQAVHDEQVFPGAYAYEKNILEWLLTLQ
jgi:hypothetical protein